MCQNTESQLTIDLSEPQNDIKRINDLLSGAKIRVYAMSLSEESRTRCLRILADRIENAQALLDSNGFNSKIERVLSVRLNSRKGLLSNITQALAQAHVNVAYFYSSVDPQDASTRLTMKVENIPLANKILQEIASPYIETPALELV